MKNKTLFYEIMTQIESLDQKQSFANKSASLIDGKHNKKALLLSTIILFLGIYLGSFSYSANNVTISANLSENYSYTSQDWLTSPVDEYSILAASY